MDLFDDQAAPAPAPPSARREHAVGAANPGEEALSVAAALPPRVHLGTSSWSFSGWKGLVWDAAYSESQLSRWGLGAYAAHPLLRAVSIDRSFYRPLSAGEYAAYAAAVPESFRFVVKAPSLVCDSLIRSREGHGVQFNPSFLDPQVATSEFVQPVLAGLGRNAGALVFQLGPLPARWLSNLPELLQRLEALLRALPSLRPAAPDAVFAVEVRNPQLLTPEFAAVLKRAGVSYCLGLHAKMPAIESQLPLLRALWPGPLVCRWSLHRKHGSHGYEEAKGLYQPFDQLLDPDPATRDVLARVIVATAAAGFNSFVTINNKAEGSAPLSIMALARAVLLHAGGPVPGESPA